MKISRRRFLTISAALACAPAYAGTQAWQGRAFGADVSLKLTGGSAATAQALRDVPRILATLERRFSLYDPTSDLSQLNATGHLARPDPDFLALMQAADQGHRMTQGLFDPTVQTLWAATAQSRQPVPAVHGTVDWQQVRFDPAGITLGPGQKLTFNGIAQGYATDRVVALLHSLGFENALVNIGEFAGLGGPWRLGLHDPVHGFLGQRTLRGNAIATSSPAALDLGAHAHILHPAHDPQWSTVSVEAKTATLADCLSTALCLAPRDLAAQIAKAEDVQRVTLVDADGNLSTL